MAKAIMMVKLDKLETPLKFNQLVVMGNTDRKLQQDQH